MFKVGHLWYNIDELFLEMDFLSSSIKIFENEKKGDERAIVY